MRTHIKPPYTDVAIDEDSEEDIIERYVVIYLNGTICYSFGIKYVY